MIPVPSASLDYYDENSNTVRAAAVAPGDGRRV
jgi:hypothetical protein